MPSSGQSRLARGTRVLVFVMAVLMAWLVSAPSVAGSLRPPVGTSTESVSARTLVAAYAYDPLVMKYDNHANLASTTVAATWRSSVVERRVSEAPGASLASSGELSAPSALDDVAAGTPVGRSGLSGELNVVSRNTPTTIGGRQYTGHALDRMQGRGLVPSVVEDAIAHGQRVPSRGGTSIFYDADNNISVILSSDGRVVTVGYGQFKP